MPSARFFAGSIAAALGVGAFYSVLSTPYHKDDPARDLASIGIREALLTPLDSHFQTVVPGVEVGPALWDFRGMVRDGERLRAAWGLVTDACASGAAGQAPCWRIIELTVDGESISPDALPDWIVASR